MAKTRGAQNPSPQKLKFKDKLLGKGLNADALLKKLQDLHQNLAQLDQETVDQASLHSVRKELVNTSLLLHKDQGVKAYVACCLADILKLYAPDAPYTQNELRDIFDFFLKQLQKYLKGQDSPYYDQYFHLLESLATVKSIIIVVDLPDGDRMMVDYVRTMFLMVKRDLPPKLRMFMAEIIVSLILEASALPEELLDAIMAQFTAKDARPEQPAYQMAVSVCQNAPDKLQHFVSKYFTDLIVTSAPNDSDEEEDEDDRSTMNIQAAHTLIKHLNHSCPAILQNVVPQLEEEMKADDVSLRMMAVQTLGEMFADKNGAELTRKYPSMWKFWLDRHRDRSTQVRLTFIEATKALIVNLPEARKAIEAALVTKLQDPDEKVRAAACALYGQLDYETVLHHVSAELLLELGGRGLDKKHLVRSAAAKSIGNLWRLAYLEVEDGEPEAVKHFSWIPQLICDMYNLPEARATAEAILAEYILPLPSYDSKEKSKEVEVDCIAWTDRLLTTMKFLNEKGIKALFNFSGIKQIRPTVYEMYVQCCIENNSGVINDNEETIKQRLNAVVRRIASSLPDATRAADDLHQFAALNDQRLYKYLNTCMNTQTDVAGVAKALSDFNKRVHSQHPKSTSILPTMRIVLQRATLRVVNQSSIPTLVTRIKHGDPAGDGHGTSEAQLTANHAHAWLQLVSKHLPALFTPHLSDLTKALAEDDNPRLVEVALQALAAAGGARQDGEGPLALDKRTTARVLEYAMGSNRRHSKFAARLLAAAKNAEQSCEELVNEIADRLSGAEGEELVAHITVLDQLARFAPDAFEQKSDVVTRYLLKKILMVPIPGSRDDEDMDEDDLPEWIEDDGVSPVLQAKILSMKVCRHRCLAHASSETALVIVEPVLKMLLTVLSNDGALRAGMNEDPSVRSRMRLQAAVSLMHLNTVQAYYDAMSIHFNVLAMVVQDHCYQTRRTFLDKLIPLLTRKKLPATFNLIPFLTVHDPEKLMASAARTAIQFVVKSWPPHVRTQDMELIFVRFLHLLAHHPDFGQNQEALTDMAKYVEFYIDLVGTEENISLLHHLAMKCKTVRDAESDSEPLYIMSELAQEVLKVRASMRSWSIVTYPGKVKLPADIFKALPDSGVRNEILKTVYLPEDMGAVLRSMKQEKPKVERKTAVKRKAGAKADKKPRKRRNAGTDEDLSSVKSDDDDDDYETANGAGLSSVKREASEDEAKAEVDSEEELQKRPKRGARTRAKAKIKEQTSRVKKEPNGNSSD